MVRIFCIPSLHVSLVYRYGHFVRRFWPPFNWIFLIPYAILTMIMRIIYNCSLPSKATIGPGIILLHTGAIYIHPATKIGANCVIGAQVVIGQSKMDDTRVPTIGNNVFIGAGAKIIGPITVGDNTIIGANAVVLKDTPKYSTMVGVPAKAVKIAKNPNRRRNNRFRPRYVSSGKLEKDNRGKAITNE
ncbi:serine acetyltransferase [bacterium]|nr:serine acetyltransferase [bacterium]MBR6462545.1 serine acetyltransferase [bacterium]